MNDGGLKDFARMPERLIDAALADGGDLEGNNPNGRRGKRAG